VEYRQLEKGNGDGDDDVFVGTRGEGCGLVYMRDWRRVYVQKKRVTDLLCNQNTKFKLHKCPPG
jgi:hypothetical protein